MFVISNKDGEIVYACESIQYARTQTNGTIILSTLKEATTAYCSENDTFYAVRETIPGEPVYQITEVENVPENIEYAAWKLEDGEISVDIEKLRASRLAEVSKACEKAIYAGLDIETSKGTEHFALTINDQTNISNLSLAAQSGETVLYHADGELCRTFSSEEMTAVAAAAVKHKTYQTTLCNHLNTWIRRAETVEELSTIHYDTQLPEDLAKSMAKLLNIEA